jgi:hypothetical protein
LPTLFEASQNTLSVCLWKENPNRLLSLWDMEFAAGKAIKALEFIERLKATYATGNRDIPSPTYHAVCADEFENLAAALEEINLSSQARMARDIAAFERKHGKGPTDKELERLTVLTHHDIESFKFEAIPRDRVPYYEATRPR